METNPVSSDDSDNQEFLSRRYRQGDRVLTLSGYAFVMVSVLCFGVIAFLKLRQSVGEPLLPHSTTWLDLVEQETSTISLLFIAVVAAMLGKGLLTSVHMADAQTIPYEDLPLIRQAVIDGKPEPIDQYVRLRALSGISGNFTKLGVTGLPLTTVFLTLVFAAVSLLPLAEKTSTAFLDLAKLTLGAFIGSFVQGRVEQRRMVDSERQDQARRSDLIA